MDELLNKEKVSTKLKEELDEYILKKNPSEEEMEELGKNLDFINRFLNTLNYENEAMVNSMLENDNLLLHLLNLWYDTEKTKEK